MSNQYPLKSVTFGDYTKILKKNEARFVYTGISTNEANLIIDACEELFEMYYDYSFFIESKVFGDYKDLYQFGCYYFYPYGFRLSKNEVTKEEVENLYWY